ncbi:MAG: alpha/beta hydrolase domain-containing protein, partial [Acidimicrobiales bacterium]
MSDFRIDEISGSRAPFVAGTGFDLSIVGYQQAEYALSGVATAFTAASGRTQPADEADFATRILVYRPIESARFNGTVWVEWLNVSGGLDAAPGWIHAHTEITRRGAAWVGVSAQKTGVDGGSSLLGLAATGLVGADPERYGSLHHPGDRFSYDVFTLASRLVRDGKGTILDDLEITRVIATGDSQSAFRLTTYVNDVDDLARVHDGFMIHSRGGGAAPLDQEAQLSAAVEGDPVFFRDDLRVPVFCVEAETDVITLQFINARQEEADKLSVWEMAGTSHADMY